MPMLSLLITRLVAPWRSTPLSICLLAPFAAISGGSHPMAEMVFSGLGGCLTVGPVPWPPAAGDPQPAAAA